MQGISVLICTSKEYSAVYLCGGEDIASKERIGDAEHHLGLPVAMSTDKTEGGTYESSKKIPFVDPGAQNAKFSFS